MSFENLKNIGNEIIKEEAFAAKDFEKLVDSV